MSVITKRFHNIQQFVHDERSDLCVHVVADPGAAYVLYSEDDCWGPVGWNIYCRGCFDSIESDVEQGETCHDCHVKKAGREITQWRWYDFYAAQGDEPLPICDECWDLPAHKRRRAQDKKEYEREMRYYDND